MYKTPEIIVLKKEDSVVAGEILERAFANDPLNVYTAPDPTTRRTLFSWLFTQLVRTASVVYTTSGQINGVAVWIPPQTSEAEAVEGAANELGQMEHVFGSEAYQRFVNAFAYFEASHQQHMAAPHWYLQLLGVAPHSQGQGIGSALIAPVLQQADRQGLPCYLETFVADNVRFYQQHGFQVVASGKEPDSLIPFWSMMRGPRQPGI